METTNTNEQPASEQNSPPSAERLVAEADSTVAKTDNIAESEHHAAKSEHHHKGSGGHGSHSHHALPVSKKPKKTSPIIVMLMALLLIILVFNQFQVYSMSNAVGKKIADAENAAMPAKIQLIAINDKSCTDCASTEEIIAAIKSGNVNITSENAVEYNSSEANELIKAYSIKAVPALIIKGDIKKVQMEGFTEENGALILSEPSLPYLNLTDKKIVGRIRLTLLKPSGCDKCTDLNQMILQMKAAGISIYGESIIEASSQEGAELIQRYSITKTPTMLLSKEASQYPLIGQAWPQIGTVEKDGVLVMRNVNPPYVDVESGKTLGLVSATLLNDTSCKECYDVTQHLRILEGGFGAVIGSESRLDASSAEGKEIIKKYNITAVPTIIFTGAEPYESLKQSWLSVGTIENDGAYIFRTFSNWPGHAYRDLVTGSINPNPAPAAPQQ